jgi:hypothetical protein
MANPNGDMIVYAVILFVGFVCVYMYFKNSDMLQLKCIVSSVDGNKYCVRDREKLQEAADLLAKVTNKCKKLVEYMVEKHPNDTRTKMLNNGFNPKRIMETLPTSSYTAYSENKGEKIAFCLSPKKKNGEDTLIDEHTLMFVALHELTHVCTKEVGHPTVFWENFKFLLENAKESKLHEPKDYNKTPQKYCSMQINDNPYYDM